MIGNSYRITGELVEIIGKQPTHPEGKIWTAITEDNELRYFTNNDLKQRHGKQSRISSRGGDTIYKTS